MSQKLKEENEALKRIIKDTLWMAYRYADGRSTYAPQMFNDAVHVLDSLQLSHLYIGELEGGRFASDGMFGIYDPVAKKFTHKGE